MESISNPHAVSLGRQPSGYVVKFSDGKKGFYPDTLLYAILELTEPVDGQDHRIGNYSFFRQSAILTPANSSSDSLPNPVET